MTYAAGSDCARCHEALENWWRWCPYCGLRTGRKAWHVKPPHMRGMRELAMHDVGFVVGRYWPTDVAWALDTSDQQKEAANGV